MTGGLDPMDDRHTWLEMGRSLSQPVQAIPISKAMKSQEPSVCMNNMLR
ncbi:MAG: hypothetical protein GDA43_14470 [Hormoscilla sp. SP5CHS1]|nr:hypothetical protein [Hormoscilla sp. SP5CHS1]